MVKLPVFQTLGQTFGFVVERRFFTLLRLVWLPTLLSVLFAMLPEIYAYPTLAAMSEAQANQVLAADGTYLALNAVNAIASVVLSAIIAVSVHRLILLDDKRPGSLFNMRFSREERLYIFAWIFYGLLVLLAFAPVIGHFVVLAREHQLGGGLSSLTTAGGELDPNGMKRVLSDPRFVIALGLGCLFMLVAITRFGLVFPLIVAEGRISFWRSWVLTRGNFWQLIGFWILLTILGGLLITAMIMILAIAIVAIMGAVLSGSQTVGALGVVIFIVPAAVSFLVYIVVAITLFVAGLSFSYKALAGDAES